MLLILVPVILVTIWRVPLSFPEGDFVMNVLSVAKTGHVASTFTPDTYPYLAGIAYRSHGIPGFLLEQAAVYLLLAASLLWLLRTLIGASATTYGPRAAIVGTLVICLDPDLLSSIPKVWDTGLTSLLLIAFAGLCLLAARRASPGALLGLATVWGIGVSVRPNFALLFVPILYLLALSRERAWLLKLAAVVVWAAAIFLTINRIAHGSFYIAQNGPYNFFAGANAYTQTALLRTFNAESSIPPALAAFGVHSSYYYDLALRPVYMHYALVFLRSHPLQWLWLGCIKLMTLLRPDTKTHPIFTPGWVIKVFTALCVPVWLGTLAAVRNRMRRLERQDKLMLILVASYVLPFLLTNADPRFRTPLDVLVLAHAASLIARRPGRHALPGTVTSNHAAASTPVVAV
jgi:4-amino-4-deoxy-L-arabinose transferase-like glycosyltransferase